MPGTRRKTVGLCQRWIQLVEASGLLICMGEGASLGVLVKASQKSEAHHRVGTTAAVSSASSRCGRVCEVRRTGTSCESRGRRRVIAAEAIGNDNRRMPGQVRYRHLIARAAGGRDDRSEEHTSELQSLRHL